jgi:hypothetical protein
VNGKMTTLADHKLTSFLETRARPGFPIGDYSTEKAGVGGSTPPLATTYKPSWHFPTRTLTENLLVLLEDSGSMGMATGVVPSSLSRHRWPIIVGPSSRTLKPESSYYNSGESGFSRPGDRD